MPVAAMHAAVAALKDERGVGSTEAKGIAQRGVERGRAWLDNRIEGAARVRSC
jgi:hypothetical protein